MTARLSSSSTLVEVERGAQLVAEPQQSLVGDRPLAQLGREVRLTLVEPGVVDHEGDEAGDRHAERDEPPRELDGAPRLVDDRQTEASRRARPAAARSPT